MKNINYLTLKYIAFTIIIIFVLSIISLLIIKNNDNKQRNKLLDDAYIISAAIDVDGLKSLTASKADFSSPFYQSLKKQLFNIRTSNDSYKFLYLLGIKEDKETVFFFIDSQMPNSSDYASPGEIYSEVSDEYIVAFKTKNKMTVGPVTNRWGTMITTLIPIVEKKNGELIAVLGLDIVNNKWNKTIYTQSLPAIGFIAVVFLAAIILFLFKRKSIKEIKHREAYLEALNKISELSFDSVSAAELQSYVEIIGKVANASRTYIFKNHRNQNNELLLSHLAEYVAKGIKPEIDNPELQNINYNDWLPRWEKLLESGKMISGRVADFPENEKSLLEPQEIVSLIVIPIFIDKTFWGFLGFDNCNDDSDWNDNDIKYLKIATRRLENAIQLVAKQKLLKAENSRFKALSEATYEAIFVSEKGICIDANKAASIMFAYSHKELIGIFGTDVIANESKELVKSKMLAGIEEPYEAIAQRKDGSKFQAEFQGRMYNYNDKKVRVTAVRDITKRKKADEQIRKFSQVVETTSQSVVITDLEGNIIFVNEALLKTAGFDNESEIIGKSMYAFTDEQGVIKLNQKILPNIFGKGSFYNYEINIRKKDNTFYLAEINGSFIPNEVGKPEFLVAMFSDITKRKQIETELIAAKEKTELSNRLKTAFLNNMSHEIRTPLNGINGFLELLQDPNLDTESKQEYINIISISSNRLITTVTDIMEISKIEAGLIDVYTKEVSINKVLNELYDFFSLDAKNQGLKLIQFPSLSDDESVVLTDNQKLNGILANLIKNAIKFTDKGSVTFGYNIITDTASGSSIHFYVKDTGIGVPQDRQQAIFNRFEQADIEDTRAFEGSGLGLAIAKSYVEILGGKIWLKSEEGFGSEFMFTIPYKGKTSIVKKEKQQKESENKQGNLKAMTILIAEDEEVNNQLYEVVFKNTFKQIIYVKNGQQAIETCKAIPKIDLILMDIKMPVMNGYTATREIRKFNKEIIIIAQTAFGLKGDREKAIEAGCNDYIAKPINKNLLFEMIKLHF